MPWRIPEDDLNQVKRDTDLLALIRSRGIELAPHGTKDFIGRCPFHDDQNKPNFIVSPAKGLWHCMACGKAGNVIQFVQHHDGVSFRHAFDLLRAGGPAVFSSQSRKQQATVPVLPCPLDAGADDATLYGQVVGYYHERLKQTASARAYLASRGLDHEELINHFQLGFADRSLGLRLPDKNRKEGEALRSRLTQLGLWRESGHEHFNGCVVVPFQNEAGHLVSLYGRRVQHGNLKHLYPSGPHLGLFNRECLNEPEIILCEAVMDALTFWANGFKNVTCLYGTEGFTEELWEALRKVRRVRLAYDADDAGDRAAERDAERFKKHGVEVFRVKFPHGMDANEYAQKVTPADKSLAVLLNAAVWMGKGCVPTAAPPEPVKAVAMVVDEATGDPLPIVDYESLTTGIGWAPAPMVPAAYEEVQAQSNKPAPASSSLAASVSRSEEAAKKEKPGVSVSSGAGGVTVQIGDREWRVRGIENNTSFDLLKVNLRLLWREKFHLDTVDLNQSRQRQAFVQQSVEATGLENDLVQRDLARVLLEVEGVRDQHLLGILKPAEAAPKMTPEERDAALAWLKAPDLIGRLRKMFHQAGVIGEENNTLVAYLAGVSRKLERPLAIIIQSASAAGKTTLMDAVLSFFPEEDRVKYSAMTGQSLYYLGETNLKHKILAVVEESGAEKASYALKLLQSEGELTIASTGKDPQTGKMVTQEYHVEGPVMIFLTTTAIDMDEELQNRCLTLAVDESAEQTRRIHQLQRERRTLAGLLAKTERLETLKKLRNAQRLLETVEVLNPYAPGLTFATTRTRNRRDHEKYLTLIDAIALLHQHQREQKTLPNGQRYLEVTLEDIALANELAPEILGRSLDELPPQTRRLLGHIREVIKAKVVSANGQPRGKMGAGPATFSRKEICDHCGWSMTQVSLHLERLVALEYLALRHGTFGRPFIYEILFDLDTPDEVAHVGLIDAVKLKHAYESDLTDFCRGVTGKKGQVTGGNETGPIPLEALALNHL